ncbi:MAG: metallophosphoesterase [Clostridiales bacterium]|nr:metallophosphoesterase [Clostridiales bacterium]MDD6389984.1 metallophosphoesterase [Bacillota bacterium]MDY5975522.1 metallophosphoesterase [Anaerovoracaceae bacterium]
MSIYAIGDPHLSFDERLDKPMDIFGDAWDNHAERLKENWIREIKEDDTVILAGDISWGLTKDEAYADFEWLHQLPGMKVIIKGNHDLWWTGITRLNMLYDDMFFLQNTYYLAEGTAICGSRGWICPGYDGFTPQDEKIYRRELLRLEASLKMARDSGIEDIIGVLHYPPTNDKLQKSGFTELFEKYGVRNVVYGHLHGKDAYRNGLNANLNGVRYQLVSLDYIDACPVLLKG